MNNTFTKDELERSLNYIERTHLLFEKHSSLLAFLRKRTRKNKHSLGYYKRTDTCLERDYKECERLAIRLSNGYLNNQTDSWLSNGTSLETRKTFRFLLDCYEEASKCTQLNNNARVKTESLLYRIPESSKGPAAYFERLSDIIISFINGQEKYDYEPFRLDLCCPWKICGNFYTSIAILLLLNIIPRCDGRLRSSPERLDSDTEKFMKFIATLEAKCHTFHLSAVRETKNIYTELCKSTNSKKQWCRFLMIVQLTKIIDEIFYYVNPNFTIAFDERRELIRLPFIDSTEYSFWKDENDEGYKKFYYIEQFPKDLEKIRREGLDFIIPYTMFLYKFSTNKNEVERFGLQLFDTGELAYRSIEYDSKILHNQSDDDTEMIGSYTISKDTFDFIVYGNEKNDTKRLSMKLRKLTEDERLRLACDELVYERIKMSPGIYIKGFNKLIQPIATKVAAFFMANTLLLEGNNKKIWYVEFNPQVKEAKAIFDSISLANVDIVSDNDYIYLHITYPDGRRYSPINITLETRESTWEKYGIRISEKSL